MARKKTTEKSEKFRDDDTPLPPQNQRHLKITTTMVKGDKTVLVIFKDLTTTILEVKPNGETKEIYTYKSVLGDMALYNYVKQEKLYTCKGYEIKNKISNVDDVLAKLRKGKLDDV